MALNKYSVKVNDYETVLQLSDKDAKARGLTEKNLYKPAKNRAADKAAADKAAADKAAADKAAAEKSGSAPANKARTAAADK
ncbi:hypothetical protein SEA_TAYLORSIPHT_8 [Arthrobacter phage TaylorSipht]|nr:hypothetical protein SEA_TAYLORSIPHT_8 [Arthrobacter phage TaylorSipht]